MIQSVSDKLIEDKIKELANGHSYKDYIYEYYRDIQSIFNSSNINENVLIRKKYNFVLKSIKNIWKSTEKNSSIFKHFKDFEPILQMQDKYRDHFIHSYNVFLLGYYILNSIQELGYTDLFKRSSNPNLTWMLTSTFHDVGYPIQNIDTWLNKMLENFLGIDPNLNIDSNKMIAPIYLDFMKIISSEHKSPLVAVNDHGNLNSYDWNYLSDLNSYYMKKDHGVLSSLILMHNLWIQNKFFEREGIYGNILYNHLPACHAISIHNMFNNKINVDKHRFAYLLCLCDEIQEWGRPSKITKCSCNLINIEIKKKTIPNIIIEIELNDSNKEEYIKNITKRFYKSNSINTYIKESNKLHRIT